MDKKSISEAVKKAKENSSKRNFKQTVDLIINLKDLNLKNPDEQVEFFITARHGIGINRSVCALVGPELKDEAEKVCDEVVPQNDLAKMEKNKAKKLAKSYDYFVAQGNIMPQVAMTLGRYLGPKGKMPNPKAGCIVPPKANLKPLYEKLQNTLKISAKKTPLVQVAIGKEDMKDEELAENIWQVYDQLIHHLPKEHNNVKDVYVKLTMGKPVKVQ